MSIGSCAFMYSQLRKCDIPSGVENIWSNSFNSCQQLKSLKLPNNVTIGSSAFRSCNSLIMPVFGEESLINSFDFVWFSRCENILYFFLPKSVTNVSNGLSDSENIISFGIQENNVYYSKNNCIIRKADNMVVSACAITVLPKSANIIGNSSFLINNSLTTLRIPYSISVIQSLGVRYWDALTTIYLDNPNIILNNSSFQCDKIQTVYYNGTREQYDNKGQTWIRSMFNSSNKEVTIHFKDGTTLTI